MTLNQIPVDEMTAYETTGKNDQMKRLDRMSVDKYNCRTGK